MNEKLPTDDGKEYKLRLYVGGQTPKSLHAYANLKKICEEHLHGRYHIEVIDLFENPQLAKGDQILAVPTLVRQLPQPICKIIGDLSDTERVLVGLDLVPAINCSIKIPKYTQAFEHDLDDKQVFSSAA